MEENRDWVAAKVDVRNEVWRPSIITALEALPNPHSNISHGSPLLKMMEVRNGTKGSRN